MALDLVKRGWKVYATSIDVSSMADLHKSGCEVGLPNLQVQPMSWILILQVLPLDVMKVTDIEATTMAIGSHLDLLINNVRFLFHVNGPYLIAAGGSRRPGTVTRHGPRAIA